MKSDPFPTFLLQAQSTLAANVLSSLSALSGFIFLSVRLAALGPAFQTCKLNERSPHPYFSLFQPFQQDCSMAKSILAVSIFRWGGVPM